MDALVFFVPAQHGRLRSFFQRALKRNSYRRHGSPRFLAEVAMGLRDLLLGVTQFRRS